MSIFTPELIILDWNDDTRASPSSAESAPTEKERCLQSIVNLLEEKGVISGSERIYDKLIERENTMTTGIGNHIAIPHIRDEAVNDFKAVIYLLDKDIDFNSLDNKKVKLIICFAVPQDSGDYYMKVLSKIVEFLRDTGNRSNTFNKKTKEELYSVFRRLEDEVL